MKREQLKTMGLTDEQIDQIMAEAGKDVEAGKSATAKAQEDLKTLQAQLDTTAGQLTEAGKQIEAFKGMDIDGIKKAADEWKAQAEKAKTDYDAQLADMHFSTVLEKAIAGFGVHDAADVMPLLKRDTLKLNDAGQIIGLKEQIEPLQTVKPYLFKAAATDPVIVATTTPLPSGGIPAWAVAAEKAAGVKIS